MYPWIPIVKKTHLEPFATTEAESRSIVGTVFISVSLMILALLMAFVFYWSYQKSMELFFAIFTGLVFLYTIKVVILVSVMRSKLNPIVFKLYMGSTVFMSLLTLMMFIYFIIKSTRRSGSSSSIVPGEVRDYNASYH